MNYVYCPFYSAIYFALHLRSEAEEVAVITDNESVRRFCDYAEIRVISLSPLETRLPRLTSGHRLLERRRYLDSVLRSLDVASDDCFYFLSPIRDFNPFYLAKRWAERGKAYFAALDLLTSDKLLSDQKESDYSPRQVRSGRRAQFMMRLVFGLDLKIYDHLGVRLDLGIDEEFLQANGIAMMEIPPMDGLILEAMERHSVDVGGFDNLLASGYPAVLGNMKCPDSLRGLYERVLSIVPKMAIKAHPDCRTDYDAHQETIQNFFHGYEVLPTFLPAELLLKNVRKTVVSIQSSVLVYAAGIGNLRAISLMDLVDYKENKQVLKETAKRRMREMSGDRIVFPRDHDELEQLLLA